MKQFTLFIYRDSKKKQPYIIPIVKAKRDFEKPSHRGTTMIVEQKELVFSTKPQTTILQILKGL